MIPYAIPRAFIHHSFISKGSWYTMAHISNSSRKQISFSIKCQIEIKFQLEMCAIVYHDPSRHPTGIHSPFIHSQGIMVYYGTHFRFITKTNSISFKMKTNSTSISLKMKTNSISISFNIKINSISNFNFNFILKTNSISILL